jgi:hypothetical protein
MGVPWIGEHLLRTLDFWSPDRLKTSLGMTASSLKGFDCICVKRNEPGKSGDFLSNVLRKHARSIGSSMPIEDFANVLEGTDLKNKRILFTEDSLLTGTEMTNYFSGLLCLSHKTGRPWSVSRISSPERLSECEIELRFGVITSLGGDRLGKFLLRLVQ